MQLQEALDDLTHIECKLLLIVGKPGTGKSKMIKSYADALGLSILDLNTIINNNPKKENIINIFSGFLQEYKKDVILIDKKEILYQDYSEVDILEFLKELSKRKTVIATWNGYVENNLLYHIRNNETISYPLTDDYRCFLL